MTVPTSAAAPMPVTAFPTMPEVRTLENFDPILLLRVLRLAILLIGVLLFELDDLRLVLDDLRFGSYARLAVLRTPPFRVDLLRLFSATSFLVALF